jgi:hypothetical protein
MCMVTAGRLEPEPVAQLQRPDIPGLHDSPDLYGTVDSLQPVEDGRHHRAPPASSDDDGIESEPQIDDLGFSALTVTLPAELSRRMTRRMLHLNLSLRRIYHVALPRRRAYRG